MNASNSSTQPRFSRGMMVVGVFLFFGAAMVGLAGTTLLWRDTFLDRAWALNPRAYRELAPLSSIVGALFLLLSAALFAAGLGWFRRRLRGWWLAVGLTATQVLGTASISCSAVSQKALLVWLLLAPSLAIFCAPA
ncbi:MAG TPA: hypothetical protein VFI95_08285 [Terriglobales bacterium]|nr:hypothetical protein [Terriglobales bacterium]